MGVAVRRYHGDPLRASFSTPGGAIAYRTRIGLDDAAGHLRLAESNRVDGAFAQSGHVSMPNLSGHIYLVTNEQRRRSLRDYEAITP